ncbi:hypothetical protein GCM10009555_015120 [Acrocarpospora macrocephala]|uniref:DUF2637 domain-containing protein n=1 Tax=Acrocarpospora macrocephala TaxID=150177 RepID=A0A5M3X5K7_9ACTN|nr:DUF2637 domain-containing protein [Acrocarpospora macrocephala]GES14153.1 hypothetical protein Amac_077500 [Acrocarpospora macrocephala]
MAERLTRITTALAVLAVAAVAAVISYQHAYELVSSHGESGITARLVPFTMDGLIWAASMVILDASRSGRHVPGLAKWSLGVGIVATVGANVAHGMNHGIVGALVSAWPAVALVGSFELLMMLTRRVASTDPQERENPARDEIGSALVHVGTIGTIVAQSTEEAILADYVASLNGPGRPLSQRFLAEKHGVDRRKVRQIVSAISPRQLA